MSNGLWAALAAIAGLILTFILGRKAGSLKASEKQNKKLEQEVVEAKAETELAKVEERNAETKAAASEAKADLAVKVFRILTDQVPYTQQTEPLREMEQEVRERAPEEQSPEELALEIARRQAAQAESFMEDHR